MKKFKKLISLVCSLAMAASFVVMPNIADAALTEKVILDLTFDTEAVEMVAADSNNAVTATWQEGEYIVIKDTKAWSFGSIVFDEAMGAGDYNINFDFAFTASGGNYGAIYLTDEAHNGNNQFQSFGLLTDSATEAKVGPYGSYAVASGLSYTRGNWYNYDMDVNTVTGAYTVTITDLENAENKGTVSGNNLPTSLTYDRIMFGTGVEVKLDNLKVNGWYDPSLYLDVKSEDMSTANSYVAYYGTTYCNDAAESSYQAHFNDWNGALSTGGWPFARTISGADAKTYEVKFDFNVATAGTYTTAMFGLSGETNAGWDSSPATYNSGYKFWQISSVVDGGYKLNWGDTEYATSTWYSMTTYISPETGYERKIITERESGDVVADTGWVALDTSTTGFLAANTYDKLRFTANKAKMNIDNVSVYAVDFPAPAVKSVTALADGVEQAYANTFTNAIKIEFTKAMDKEAVAAPGVVTLSGVGFTFGDWSEDGKTVILNLANALEDDTTYTLAVTTDALAADGTELFSAASQNITVDNTLLEADIDNTNPTPYQQYPNGSPKWYTVEEEDGNKYMNLYGYGYYQAGWGGPTYGDVGYMFARPMSADVDYTIDFDFRMNSFEEASKAVDGLIIANHNDTKDGTWKDRTSLVAVNALAPICDIGTYEGNLEWAAEKWYSYHAELTDGNVWNVTVTDKADSSKKATLTGEFAYDTLDRIAATAKTNIDLDNISIEEKGAEAPAVVSVGFGGVEFPPFVVITQMPVFSMSLATQNTTDAPAPGKFIIAYYKENRLLGMSSTDFTVAVGATSVDIVAPLDDTLKTQADKITFMVVEDFVSFMPYCAAETVSQ